MNAFHPNKPERKVLLQWHWFLLHPRGLWGRHHKWKTHKWWQTFHLEMAHPHLRGNRHEIPQLSQSNLLESTASTCQTLTFGVQQAGDPQSLCHFKSLLQVFSVALDLHSLHIYQIRSAEKKNPPLTHHARSHKENSTNVPRAQKNHWLRVECLLLIIPHWSRYVNIHFHANKWTSFDSYLRRKWHYN